MFIIHDAKLCGKQIYNIAQKGKYESLTIRNAMHDFYISPESIMDAKILAYWPVYTVLDRHLYFSSKEDAEDFIQDKIMPMIIANKLIRG